MHAAAGASVPVTLPTVAGLTWCAWRRRLEERPLVKGAPTTGDAGAAARGRGASSPRLRRRTRTPHRRPWVQARPLVDGAVDFAVGDLGAGLPPGAVGQAPPTEEVLQSALRGASVRTLSPAGLVRHLDDAVRHGDDDGDDDDAQGPVGGLGGAGGASPAAAPSATPALVASTAGRRSSGRLTDVGSPARVLVARLVLEAGAGMLVMVNAGGVGVLVRDPRGRVRRVDAGAGPPLGRGPDPSRDTDTALGAAARTTAAVPLLPGSWLVVCDEEDDAEVDDGDGRGGAAALAHAPASRQAPGTRLVPRAVDLFADALTRLDPAADPDGLCKSIMNSRDWPARRQVSLLVARIDG